jgi:hypothetical protein
MSQQPGSEPYGDYEYDEAHAAAEVVGSGGGTQQRPRPAHVPTQTPDPGGDWSYDLAHDVPRGSAG